MQQHINVGLILNFAKLTMRGHNSVVECPLRMRKAPGSNPGASKLEFSFNFFSSALEQYNIDNQKNILYRKLIYAFSSAIQ